MFCFIFLLGHKILVKDLMARLCNLPSILTLTAGKVQYAPDLCVHIHKKIFTDVFKLGSVCSRTQLCHIGVLNDYIKQLHVSAFSGHLQVVLREQT